MVAWVEKGIVPETLEAINYANQKSLLCPYPEKAVYSGTVAEYSARGFACQ